MRPVGRLNALKAADQWRELDGEVWTSWRPSGPDTMMKNEKEYFCTLHIPSDDQSISTLAAARGAKAPNMQSGHAVDRIIFYSITRGQKSVARLWTTSDRYCSAVASIVRSWRGRCGRRSLVESRG